MTNIASLPVIVQDLLCFWSLLLCFAALAVSMLLIKQKRRLPLAGAAALFAAAYVMMHLYQELARGRASGETIGAALRFGESPAALQIALLLILSVLAGLLYRNILSWRASHISLDSIRESIDGLPAGVCYYRDGGRCVLVNHRMNDIGRMLTGESVRNGEELYALVSRRDVWTPGDGSSVAFRHRVFEYEGEPLHELIADDITELDERRRQLRRDVERARKLSESMKAYGRTIDERVRRSEILAAKISIHDGMNRMLLATKRALDPGTDEASKRDVLTMWENRMKLLRSGEDGEGPAGSVVEDLETLAKVYGLGIDWRGRPDTKDEAALSLFLLACREALANAAKHAGAGTLTVDIQEGPGALRARFTNDGAPPAPDSAEAGGLLNLRKRLEEAGGSMTTEFAPRFALDMTIPRKG